MEITIKESLRTRGALGSQVAEIVGQCVGFYHCYESTPNIFSFLVAADKFQRKSRQFSKLGPPSHILVIDGQCAIHDGPSKLNPMVEYKWYCMLLLQEKRTGGFTV